MSVEAQDAQDAQEALEESIFDEAILSRRVNSLAAFVIRAWKIVEPGNELLWNWHLDLICGELQKVPDEIDDLVICIPPGAMKTLLVSVFWPAWIWLKRPEERLLCFANDGDLATESSIKMREIIRSEWYQGLVKEMYTRGEAPLWTLSTDENRKVSFKNTQQGIRRCLSLGSKVTGKRCNGMIIDDPLDAKDVILGEPSQVAKRIDEINRVIEKVLPTRMEPKRSWRVMIMQRLHQNDPASRAIAGGAKHVVLPMRYSADHPQVNPADNRADGELLFPGRFNEQFDQAIMNALGGFHYAAQYDQRPQSEQGGLFHRAWFLKTYAFDAQRFAFDEIGISVDCTFKRGQKTDYVVMQAWGKLGAERYLADQVRARMNYPELRHAFKMFCQKWAHARFALIEGAANGPALIDDLHQCYEGIPLIPFNPGTYGSKHERAQMAAPSWQAGLCYVPENAPWVNDFIEEHVGFGPGAINDDQVDTGSQILIHWAEGVTPEQKLTRQFGWLEVLGAAL